MSFSIAKNAKDGLNNNSAPTSGQSYQIFNELKLDADAELTTLAVGLMANPSHLSPKYFYDELGCALYVSITLLPEYYPTRTEKAIFAEHRNAIANAVGIGKQFVDLGSGDSAKAAGWFTSLQPKRYIAVDIAESAIRASLEALAAEYSAIEMIGLVTDFSSEIRLTTALLPEQDHTPRTFFYPGSSIGNFTPESAVEFLSQVKSYCITADCGLLIGVDCKKDKSRLDAAYDDALGVTAAFNLNALRHVNRLLNTNFEVLDWAHRGFYNADQSRIEMHLEAKHDVTVSFMMNGQSVVKIYKKGDRIHSENSYKYAPTEFQTLLAEAGFSRTQLWQDPSKDFAVFYAQI